MSNSKVQSSNEIQINKKNYKDMAIVQITPLWKRGVRGDLKNNFFLWSYL
jgi:hypothetical protein